jgi:DNA polymerase III delta prime subunit
MHFIGKTQLIALVLQAKIPRLKPTLHSTSPSPGHSNPIDRRWLFTGPAGVGKSALAKSLGLELAGHPLNLDTRMGTALSVDLIRDWVRNAPYRPLIGDMTIRLVDELDTVPPTALCELRGYLDELPASVVFIATTNRPVKDLAEPLQSRFQVWKFDPVQTSVIVDYLVQQFPQLAPDRLADIATKAAGNVRAAIADATSEMDVLSFRQLTSP